MSMRRLLLTLLALAGLALPAAAVARSIGPNDGTLVVRGGDNGDGVSQGARPVVTLTITGFAIGRIAGVGRIDIYDLDPTNDSTPEVTGADSHRDVTRTVGDQTQTGTRWTGTSFSFRAAEGTYRIVIYGSGVYLFAGGKGRVSFTGNPDPTIPDGGFSINGGDFRSLPLDATKPIGTVGNG